jgi:hypothetical protein
MGGIKTKNTSHATVPLKGTVSWDFCRSGFFHQSVSPQPQSIPLGPFQIFSNFFYVYFFGGLECVGHSFSYVAHLLFLRDVSIRTQSATVASWREN